MTRINKVILVAALGRLPRKALDVESHPIFDKFVDALRGFHSVFEDALAGALAQAACRLGAAIRELRKVGVRLVIPLEIATPRMLRVGRTAAFFHAAKVDARNLP